MSSRSLFHLDLDLRIGSGRYALTRHVQHDERSVTIPGYEELTAN